MSRSYISAVVLAVFALFSQPASSAVQVAPANRVNLFLDSASPFTTNDWTVGVMGSVNVKILKSTANSVDNFLAAMNAADIGISDGKRFKYDPQFFVDSAYARVNDTKSIYTGQCVDFAKLMISNSSATSSWHAGKSLATIPNNQLATSVVPGTMIAYFAGLSTYPAKTGHVAIVLSWLFDANGKPLGVNVVDQNFLLSSVTVNGVNKGVMDQTISKHFLPWTGSSNVGSASKYNIVDLY